jgi:hypothetical protein
MDTRMEDAPGTTSQLSASYESYCRSWAKMYIKQDKVVAQEGVGLRFWDSVRPPFSLFCPLPWNAEPWWPLSRLELVHNGWVQAPIL